MYTEDRTEVREGSHLLNDVLCGADAWRFDDCPRLLWRNVVHLDKETLLLRAQDHLPVILNNAFLFQVLY